MIQSIILTLGAATIYFITRPGNRSKRMGYIIGFISEPFWLYSAHQNDQWGIAALCVAYAFLYAQGYYYHRFDN